MYLGEEAWPEVGRHDGSLALVPLGSTEQHGPHLPEGTDHLIAEGLAREAATRTDSLCTPVVPVGVSAHHRQFPGTLSVDPPAFRAFLESMTRSLAYHGVDRVVYVNAHGGNVEPLREVGRRLHAEECLYAVPWMWDESIPELVDELFAHNGPHAGPKETAMIQHLHPALVHDDRLSEARDGGAPRYEEESGPTFGARTFYDAVENSDNGAFGDQTDATAEKGERLFSAAVEQLVRLCDWLDDQPFEALMPEGRVGEA